MSGAATTRAAADAAIAAATAEAAAAKAESAQAVERGDALAAQVEELGRQIQTLLDAGQSGAAGTRPGAAPFPSTLQASMLAKPPLFAGKPNQDVRSWVQQLELRHGPFKCDEPQKVLLALTHLEGDAFTFVNILRAQPPSAGAVPIDSSWDRLKGALVQQFGGLDPQFVARTRIRSLSQTGTVQEYLNTFKNLRCRVGDMNDAEAVDKFLAGLNEKVVMHVVQQRGGDVMSFEEVTTAALHYARGIDLAASSRAGRSHTPAATQSAQLHTMDAKAKGRQGQPPRRVGFKGPPGATMARQPMTHGKLTDAEKEFLRANAGCFYCKKPNAGHMVANCPVKRDNEAARSRPNY